LRFGFSNGDALAADLNGIARTSTKSIACPSMPQPLPNLHHVELFYHVARAGGISAAVRSMPYGIQQPAVSGQISQLEAELGVRLFQRRPFQLTPAGRELYEFCAPFFGGLAEVAARISGTAARHLRLAAPATVIRDHLPDVLSAVKERFPELELTLFDVLQDEALRLLEREEIDLAITELEGKPPSGTRCEVLLTLPLVLFLPPGCAVPRKGLPALAAQQPLIRPPSDQAIARLFASGLARRGIHWPARIEIGTLDLIVSYAARGFGVGVGVAAPGMKLPEGVEVHELKGFPELRIAALWRGRIGPLAEQVLERLRAEAKRHGA
jgi:DNA-binding transcriptional LysR family regulator